MIVMSQVTAIAKDLSQWGYVVQFLFLINDQLSPWSVTHRPYGLPALAICDGVTCASRSLMWGVLE